MKIVKKLEKTMEKVSMGLPLDNVETHFAVWSMMSMKKLFQDDPTHYGKMFRDLIMKAENACTIP